MDDLITGIQQVGIGVTDAVKAMHYYKNNFGMNVKLFDDTAAATLMKKYTGDEKHRRHAILLLNMGGGGGFELWQFTDRAPQYPAREIQLGDLGIFGVKIKTPDVHAAYHYYKNIGGFTVSSLHTSPDGRNHFWVKDEYGNHFNITEGINCFKPVSGHCGGVSGAVICVKDMKKAIHFYAEVLGIDHEVYNNISPIADMPGNGDPSKKYHRVLLKKRTAAKGAFSRLLGDTEIELVQATEAVHTSIYKNRYWGDCGFIHLCFDVNDMDKLKSRSEQAGFPFSVDSKDSFCMESASGRFCYVEDPCGTLIELVETHRVPVFKKAGLYLDLKKRKSNKPLPDWMVSIMGFNKVK